VIQKKRIPPARRRYEQKNPQVSIRIDTTTFQQLEGLAGIGLSKAAVVKLGLKTGLTYADAYQRGYEAALSKALDRFDEGSDAWNELCELVPDDP
jgi:hypothetical protein